MLTEISRRWRSELAMCQANWCRFGNPGIGLGLCNDLETIYCSQDKFYCTWKDILLFSMSKSQDSSAGDLVKFLEWRQSWDSRFCDWPKGFKKYVKKGRIQKLLWCPCLDQARMINLKTLVSSINTETQPKKMERFPWCWNLEYRVNDLPD